MPIPADPLSVGGVRKKRKGSFVAVKHREVAYQDPLVQLPHEKLYQKHLPAADRYFKSFMHRDAINLNIITKCVF